MQTHKDLQVWKLSIELVTDIYRFTRKIPKEELFGLISQVRRATVSIAANIAEGAARKSTKEYIRFLYISLGSGSELDTLMLITKNIYQVEIADLQMKLEAISKMLVSLIAALERKLNC
jgi:four helix bundle protein